MLYPFDLLVWLQITFSIYSTISSKSIIFPLYFYPNCIWRPFSLKTCQLHGFFVILRTKLVIRMWIFAVVHKSITLAQQSWTYGALVVGKCWLAACCCCRVEDLASLWLLASVGWASMIQRGGSTWWCQRKSCPFLCVSLLAFILVNLSKKT